MLEIEIVNRSGVGFATREIEALCRSVLAAEQVVSGDLGVALVGPEEMRALKREHLGSTRRPTSSRSRSTGATSFPPGTAAARRRRPLPAGRRRGVAPAARARSPAHARLRARPRDGGAGGGAPRMSTTKPPRRESPFRRRPPLPPEAQAARRGTPSIIQSFNYAFEGVIWVLRNQRNMRIHFAIATVVLVLAFAYDVTKLELVALLLAIAFVLIAEMINTAIEAATDIATTSFDPLAKLAKDIAAGAVLIAVRQRDRRRLPRARRPARRTDRTTSSRGCATRRSTSRVIALARRDLRGHRDEGHARSRHADARRASLRPRRARVRRLDGDHVRDGGLRPPGARVGDRVRPRPARRPDAGRVGHPLDRRGRPRGRPSEPAVTLVLFQAFG